MTGPRSAFLTAEWCHVVMLNFDVDPAILQPFVPSGTELDAWRGRTFVSLVGFLFLDTRVFGIGIPFHRDFEEVNLRFYVRRKASDGWRRAVVFIKELVPRMAIALTARLFYGENYVAVPMSHTIDLANGTPEARRVSYRWRLAGQENVLSLVARGQARELEEGSAEEFITAHYWGYARRRDSSTTEYQVEHPRWRVWAAHEARFEGDAARLYGPRFAECLKTPPSSAFLADGSRVTVYRGTRLTTPGTGS